MRLFAYIGLVALAAAPLLYLGARLYVASLLSLATRSSSMRIVLGMLFWLFFVPVVVAPLFIMISLPGAREAIQSSVALLAWLMVCYVSCCGPGMFHLHRCRAELRELGFFK